MKYSTIDLQLANDRTFVTWIDIIGESGMMQQSMSGFRNSEKKH